MKQRQWCWLFFLLYAAMVLHAAFYTPITFDVAYFATFGKNIASGYGWADSFHEKTWFVATTSGPLVYLPAALMIGWLGNEIWVPAITAALCHLFWLAIFIACLRRYLKNDMQVALIVASLFFVFVYYEAFWWSTLLGELQALLLLLIASIVAVSVFKEERWRFFLLGVLAGLSIYAKMIALPGFGGIALYLLAMVISGRQDFRGKILKLFYMALYGLIGIIIVLVPFRLVEAWVIYHSDVSYIDFIKYKKSFYSNTSSMGVMHLFEGQGFFTNLFTNVRAGSSAIVTQLKDYGLSVWVQCLLAVSSLAAIVVSARSRKSLLDYWIIVLGLALILSMFYYLVLMEGIFVRYAIHPVFLLFIVIFVSCARWFSWRGVAVVSLALFLMLPMWRMKMITEMASFQAVHMDKDGNNIRLNQLNLEAVDYIENHTFNYQLAGCGWMGAPRSLEYLLEKTENFKDCFVLIEEALVFSEQTGRYQWKHPVNFTLVIDNINWKFARNHVPTGLRQKAVLKACMKHVVYRSDLFRIMDCRFEDLEKHIDLDRDTPFMNVQPIWIKS